MAFPYYSGVQQYTPQIMYQPQIQQPIISQPQQYQVQQQQSTPALRGTWLTVDTPEQAKSLPVSADGSTTIAMLKDQNIFYALSLQSGQKVVNVFEFNELVSGTGIVQTPVQQDSLEQRIAKLEELITANLKGAANNESIPSTSNA